MKLQVRYPVSYKTHKTNNSSCSLFSSLYFTKLYNFKQVKRKNDTRSIAYSCYYWNRVNKQKENEKSSFFFSVANINYLHDTDSVVYALQFKFNSNWVSRLKSLKFLLKWVVLGTTIFILAVLVIYQVHFTHLVLR